MPSVFVQHIQSTKTYVKFSLNAKALHLQIYLFPPHIGVRLIMNA